MKIKSLIFLACIILATFAACGDNDDVAAVQVPFKVTLQMPLNLDDASLREAKAVLTNVETCDTFVIDDFRHEGDGYTGTVSVPEGTYNINATGRINYVIQGKGGNDEGVVSAADVKASANAVTATAGGSTDKTAKLVFSTYNAEEGLVITEVFFSSNTYPGTQRPYTDDQYIKIGNNSDHTIFCDSIALVESKFQTDMKWDVTPNYMDRAISIAFCYLIPGRGHDVPLEPGKELLIALKAKNHLKINKNSFDLSHADFEIYDVSPNTEFVDEDNPDVPNMTKWYSDMWSYTVLHNKGSKSYALVHMQCDSIEFLRDHFYHFTYPLVVAGDLYHGKDDAYWLPISWVVDAEVNSIKSDWLWQPFPLMLDVGWTYCTEFFKDLSRYGLAVRRRKDKNGKWIDTNNSTNDFIPRATPSLREEQADLIQQYQ